MFSSQSFPTKLLKNFLWRRTDVPRAIYSLWLPSRDQAPPIVQLCFERWHQLNPEYAFQVLEQSDVERLLIGFPIPLNSIPTQALSDIVRARLLLDKGGIWVDATLFPVVPLRQWIPTINNDGFWAFDSPAADRPISSWFLMSAKRHHVLEHWWHEIQRYWSKERSLLMDPRMGNAIPSDPVGEVSEESSSQNSSYPYFWFHYLFSLMLIRHEEVRLSWQRCDKLSAVAAHALQDLFHRSENPTELEIRKAVQFSPVQKLDWRQEYPIDELRKI
jgi:hypothetical protein